MENFEFLRNKMNLSNEELSYYLEDLIEIEKFVEENNIKFESNYKLGFYSHMVSFLERIKKRESLDNVDESIKNSIEDYVLTLSEEMISCFANKYNANLNYGEVILAAIHLQTAITMEKEGAINE